MPDTFLSDTEAPSLGLYLVAVPSGIAYEVKRASDDEFLFCGSRTQVRLFLRGYAAARGQEPRLLVLWRDVEPQVLGPYRDDDERLQAARTYRAEHGDQDGLYRLDGHDVSAFSGAELEAIE